MPDTQRMKVPCTRLQNAAASGSELDKTGLSIYRASLPASPGLGFCCARGGISKAVCTFFHCIQVIDVIPNFGRILTT